MEKTRILVTFPKHADEVALKLIKDVLTKSNQSLDSNDSLNFVNGVVIPWHVKTKYYECDLAFWLLEANQVRESTTSPDLDFDQDEWKMISSVIDAFVFVSTKLQDLDLLQHWNDLLTEDVAIKLVVVDTKDMEMIDKMQQACLDLMFELVNLQDESDEETQGLDRVVEALQSHEWPTQDNSGSSSPSLDHLNGVDDVQVKDMFDHLFAKLDMEDEDGFQEAVEKLNALKAKAENSSMEERRKLAASVALSFEKLARR